MNGIPGIGEVAVLEQPQHLRRGRAAQLARRGGLGRAADGPLPVLGEELERRGQVPHLDGPLAVAREDEPPGPGPHPAAPLALVNKEAGDDGPIHRPSDTIMVKLDRKD